MRRYQHALGGAVPRTTIGSTLTQGVTVANCDEIFVGQTSVVPQTMRREGLAAEVKGSRAQAFRPGQSTDATRRL